MYLCMYVCMYVYVCIYIYIYIHTHIHTYMYMSRLRKHLLVAHLAFQQHQVPGVQDVGLRGHVVVLQYLIKYYST